MWALFARATLTVQIVMMMLVAASIWAWAIIIQKVVDLPRRGAKAAASSTRAFWSGEPLDELYDQIGPRPRAAPPSGSSPPA